MSPVKELESGSIERNDALYPLVVSGDESARTEMIESNMALVKFQVERFIFIYPQAKHLKDELISEGYLALCTAVNKLFNSVPVENPKPSWYLTRAIQRAFSEVLESETHMQASAKTVRVYTDRSEEIPRQIPMSDMMPDMPCDDTSLRDLRELIESCAESEDERQMLTMKENGYSIREIARHLNIPRSTINRSIGEMYKRFLDESGLKDTPSKRKKKKKQ